MKDDDGLFLKRSNYLEETYFSWSIVSASISLSGIELWSAPTRLLTQYLDSHGGRRRQRHGIVQSCF